MTITFTCPGCGKAFYKSNTLSGQRAACRACHGEFVIPSSNPENPLAPATLGFTCPLCDTVYRKENRLSGQRTRCVACDTVFVVPAPPSAAPVAAPRPAVNGAAVLAPKRPAPPPRPMLTVQPIEPVSASDDEEPIVLEIIEEEDPYGVAPAAETDLRIDTSAPSRPARRPRPARPREPAGDGVLGRMIGAFDAFQELPWIARRGLIVLVAGLCLLLFLEPGARLRQGLWGLFSAGLESDDTPDAELDENPPTVVRPEILAAHEKALADLSRAIDGLAAILKGVDSGRSFVAAAPRLEAAARRIEVVGNAGEKLTRANRAEALRIRAGSLPRLESAVNELMRVLNEGLKNPELRPGFQPMRDGFAPVLAEASRDYPDALDCVVELKIPGVTRREIGDFIRHRFDLEIPQGYRRRVSMGTNGNTGIERIRLGPVDEPGEIARRIKFAKVIRIFNRRIYLAAPSPTSSDMASARAAWEAMQKTREGPGPVSGPSAKPAQGGGSAPTSSLPRPTLAPGQPAEPVGGPSIQPDAWFVVFRGRDPRFWNTDTPTGPTRAVPLARVPANVGFLRLTRLDTGEALIVPVVPAGLGTAPIVPREGALPPRWSGTNHDAWGARHLGVVEGPLLRGSDPAMHGAMVVQDDGTDGYTGSGFGHLGFGESKQSHAWRGKEIPPTDFEIAVGPGPLTPAEQAQTLPGNGR